MAKKKGVVRVRKHGLGYRVLQNGVPIAQKPTKASAVAFATRVRSMPKKKIFKPKQRTTVALTRIAKGKSKEDLNLSQRLSALRELKRRKIRKAKKRKK